MAGLLGPASHSLSPSNSADLPHYYSPEEFSASTRVDLRLADPPESARCRRRCCSMKARSMSSTNLLPKSSSNCYSRFHAELPPLDLRSTDSPTGSGVALRCQDGSLAVSERPELHHRRPLPPPLRSLRPCL